MLNIKFILRQLWHSRIQAAIFVACVILSIGPLVTLNGFSTSVNRTLLDDARALQGGDIIIRSSKAFSTALQTAIKDMEQQNRIWSSRVYGFTSMVRPVDADRSILTRLKVVTGTYPLYGRCILASGRDLKSVLKTGQVVVQDSLLERLQVRVGDILQIGEARLKIADVLLKEPDQPFRFSLFGPRVLISAADLDRLDLVKPGSRVRHRYLLKVAPKEPLNRLVADLKAAADPDFERVDTFLSARSGIKRYLNNFVFFLSLIGIFTLFLAGIGIHSALKAFIRDAVPTVAIMKTLGASSRWISGHFLAALALLGLCGTMIGTAAGFAAQFFLPRFFKGFLQESIRPVLTAQVMLEGILLGLVVVLLFTFLPLDRLKDIKPIIIFRKDTLTVRPGIMRAIMLLGAAVLFVGLVIWQIDQIKTGIYFTLAVLALVAVMSVFTHVLLYGFRRLPLSSLMVRQALKGLFRPRNATRTIIMTLAAALAVVFSIYLIEENLDAAFVQSYPADTPNAFFLDIQPGQLSGLKRLVGPGARYYPIIRARVAAVNGERIDRDKERSRRGDNLARTFNLTYREHLLDDEQLIEGETLFRADWTEDQVSIMDTVAQMKPMKIGDRIRFNIQGVPVEARISSIRRRTRETIAPFFYFVFQKQTLAAAPQTIFTALNLPAGRLQTLQSQIVKAYPNVRVIDMAETIRAFAGVTRRMSNIVQAFTLLSIAAGLLIIVSSVYATRIARTREAVYYKVLGAPRRFVIKTFAMENLILGLSSSALALLVAQIGSWLVCRQVFEIAYRPFWGGCMAALLVSSGMIVIVGLAPSWPILQHKPVVFLRQQTEE